MSNKYGEHSIKCECIECQASKKDLYDAIAKTIKGPIRIYPIVNPFLKAAKDADLKNKQMETKKLTKDAKQLQNKIRAFLKSLGVDARPKRVKLCVDFLCDFVNEDHNKTVKEVEREVFADQFREDQAEEINFRDLYPKFRDLYPKGKIIIP